MVRLGLMLYGAYPEPGLRAKVTVRPAMTFKTHVLYVKSLPEGSPVSYGQTFHTKRTSRIATLAVGYADGYRRDLSNRGWVLIHGQKAPVVGNVTMDLTMVDVTDVPDVSEGDEVTLFGPAGSNCLPVEDLAEEIGTISYELLCAVSRREPPRSSSTPAREGRGRSMRRSAPFTCVSGFSSCFPHARCCRVAWPGRGG